jgi:prolyl oligopeptidase
MSILTHDSVVETIHGVEVRDPYRWLEDRELKETEEWINRQNQYCDQYFSRSGCYESLRNVVSDSLFVDVTDQASRAGNKVFLRMQPAGQEQAAIWVRRDGENETRLLVDPADFGSNVAVGIVRVSTDGSLLAFSVRTSGSDAMEILIADVVRGETLPDSLPLAHVHGFVFDSQATGFYYCIESMAGSEDPSIKYHRLGTSPLNDATLFSVSRAVHRRLALFSGDKSLVAVVTDAAGTDTVQDLYIATQDCTHWKHACGEIRGKRFPLTMRGRLFLLDMEDAPNGRLLELHPPEEPRVVIPECQSRIQKCKAIGGGFLVSYLVDRKPRIEWWSVDGELIGPLTLPTGGSIELLPQSSEQCSAIFLLHESYTYAPNLWEIDLSTQGLPEVRLQIASKERSIKGTVREFSYPSIDGTHIPLILIEPPKTHFDGPRPVILFGYGGFGTPEIPRYSRLASILLRLGATIARPAIRGGSEFGEAWHQAAIRRKRQTSIDDFLAAAEWLRSERITDEQHLAIMGSSNGGLLVAAAAVQRPDLFKAVVCTGPLTDMVRYECFDHAWRWRNEYGTVADADDFKALLEYSPYHNVRENIDYPAMLFVTGDADDRCNPAHTRKMAAALQNLPGRRGPIVVDYGSRWGHFPTHSLAERIEALCRKLAFLCEQLELVNPEGASDVLLGV